MQVVLSRSRHAVMAGVAGKARRDDRRLYMKGMVGGTLVGGRRHSATEASQENKS